MNRILGIDFGLKRTGLAITDDSGIIASPLETVDSAKLMDFIVQLNNKKALNSIVLGEPKRLNNEDTHLSENVRMLKSALEKQFPDIPVFLYDERFTSKLALQSMIQAGASKKQRMEKGNIDMISACIILNSYLDSLK